MVTLSNVAESHKHNVQEKKPDMKGYILNDSLWWFSQ